MKLDRIHFRNPLRARGLVDERDFEAVLGDLLEFFICKVETCA